MNETFPPFPAIPNADRVSLNIINIPASMRIRFHQPLRSFGISRRESWWACTEHASSADSSRSRLSLAGPVYQTYCRPRWPRDNEHGTHDRRRPVWIESGPMRRLWLSSGYGYPSRSGTQIKRSGIVFVLNGPFPHPHASADIAWFCFLSYRYH